MLKDTWEEYLNEYLTFTGNTKTQKGTFCFHMNVCGHSGSR